MGPAEVIAFPKKILSPASSYANFNFQGDFGLQIRMTDRMELRVEPVVYFHVSNGYFAASNPGFDQLGAKFGISYHLGNGMAYRGGRNQRPYHSLRRMSRASDKQILQVELVVGTKRMLCRSTSLEKGLSASGRLAVSEKPTLREWFPPQTLDVLLSSVRITAKG